MLCNNNKHCLWVGGGVGVGWGWGWGRELSQAVIKNAR